MLDFTLPDLTSWELLTKDRLPVVVYGMGNGADLVFGELEKLNIPVAGVTASDGFVRGQTFRGYKLKKLSEFDGEFRLVVAFGSSRPEVVDHIRSLGETREIVVPTVPVCDSEVINRDFTLKYEKEINAVYNYLDEKSRKIYADCFRFMYSGDLAYLFGAVTDKDEIFGDYLKLGSSDAYLDLGAYKGDTVEEFLKYTGGRYSEITAVEADKKNYDKLLSNTKKLTHFNAINCAVSSADGKIAFSAAAGRQSSVSVSGAVMQCRSVDSICRGKRVTYIKADIEGSETAMLKGAFKTIKEQMPKMNIALYHRSTDFFEIPMYFIKNFPGYSLAVRKHPGIPCWDMNLYCVPRN
ncbi:MAG: FkbM family methyltransferase [Clostridia bacterium]|nr:FkbM family methyltransferase [Clostridia bacterium]